MCKNDVSAPIPSRLKVVGRVGFDCPFRRKQPEMVC